ncbi:hypothetical protein OD808_01975 [Aeromonas veronii]|uniref:hypothetical protein n=1 Tax=Aeromonas veronii TaxID=654 RepID=UPI002230EACE|nr:hypothetical protein [Aeromonas veronii]EKP0300191.1 hypothetical protein [Aeromonas veronii]MCX0429640.1 hypothetical protein [Aeromonas veronii]UZE59022.1 hypothetical protein ONR73_19540 [Aeromonas veronii]
MHRIDTSTAQKDKFGAGKNGFTSGNPQTGVPATEVPDYILDAFQEEICAVIEDPDSGMSLDKQNNHQLASAIKAIISKKGRDIGLTQYGAPMIGVPIDWPLAQMPQDIWPDCGMVFLSCAGQSFNKLTYPLAAQLYPSGVMPEHRGEFSRGWDNGRGVDPGRQLLSYQAATQLPSIYTYSSGPGLGVLVTPPINSYTGSLYPLEKPATDYESPVNGSGEYLTTQQPLTPSGSAALSTFRVRSRNIAYHKIMRVG